MSEHPALTILREKSGGTVATEKWFPGAEVATEDFLGYLTVRFPDGAEAWFSDTFAGPVPDELGATDWRCDYYPDGAQYGEAEPLGVRDELTFDDCLAALRERREFN